MRAMVPTPDRSIRNSLMTAAASSAAPAYQTERCAWRVAITMTSNAVSVQRIEADAWNITE